MTKIQSIHMCNRFSKLQKGLRVHARDIYIIYNKIDLLVEKVKEKGGSMLSDVIIRKTGKVHV